ncbi:hypothetical protein K7I13_08000 [Brucepastera parasyntrophica]|uniref:hypothetical protein n=1 Tax=Brucepastera parasyntrophica TaxID=2880008 RepID=UPI00210A555C|nr:hypothetical protein [Brucepastera parasyntrophica]ULQ58518.1 hypothetical protein K7I13_08000 [Brucepastera parasyntrophica]
MKENFKFVLRVTVIHIVTYILCGMVFSLVFNYKELFQLGNAEYFMRPFDSISSLIGPVIQIVRGLLFGLVLLRLKESVIETKRGWLKLWAIIVVIGIINTPGPGFSSIEGIVYTQLPLEIHIKGAPEILVQTLLFSCLVANPIKLKGMPFFEKNKIPLLSAVLAGVMFSLSGVVTALILKADVMAGMTDAGAFIVMFAAIIAVFFVCKWYRETEFRQKNIILPLCFYLVLAAAPTVYNYLTGSVFASWLTLAINAVPVVILFIINYYAGKRNEP